MSPPPPASKKANVVQFAAGATVDGGSAAAKIKARAQFSDDGTSSSAAIAEDRSVKSHYVLNSVIDVALGKGNLGEEEEEEDNAGEAEGKTAAATEEQQQPPRPTSKASKSRMETYKAEWAEGAAGAERPLLPEDVERWREEKARRMVAWINSSQLAGYWGSETPWWKVMLREVEAMEAGGGERGRARSRALKDLVAAFEENATEDDAAAAAAATMSFFDSLNVVEHGGGDGGGEGANDAVDCGGAAAKGTIHKGRPH